MPSFGELAADLTLGKGALKTAQARTVLGDGECQR